MFNIANFSSHINRLGTVQTNKFMVRLKSPAIFGPTEISRIYEYRASSVRIPGVNFDMQNTYRYGVGPQQKFPTNVNFSDIDVTFIDTERNDLWKHFTVWMNGIFDYTGTRGGNEASYKVEYKQYYETEVQIHVFNNEGARVNLINLKDAFPSSLSDVSLSWSDNNKLYEFSVRFSFKEWYFENYDVSEFESGAAIGPGASSQVIPRKVDTPRPNLGVTPEGVFVDPMGNMSGNRIR